ncbi:hypothetical protein [Laspinema olomoucense]|uniref:hypothetical protein n=1 Tax=Laspinema olomoucense TaxID=3231600 RepID=UPI0021BA6D62|nr:hypothetical protein [Laspinema sp. D3c]
MGRAQSLISPLPSCFTPRRSPQIWSLSIYYISQYLELLTRYISQFSPILPILPIPHPPNPPSPI